MIRPAPAASRGPVALVLWETLLLLPWLVAAFFLKIVSPLLLRALGVTLPPGAALLAESWALICLGIAVLAWTFAYRRPHVRLWTIAILLMVAAYFYQRHTGPTYPYRASIETGGARHECRLVRSQETDREAMVAIPAVDGRVSATLYWKRFKVAESHQPVDLCPAETVLPGLQGKERERLAGQLVALLPVQPAAGKLEYYLEVTVPEGTRRIPADPAKPIVIRYKDPVPGWILWPHVVMMFFAVLFGMRAGLSALAEPETMRRYALAALVGMTAGGMMLGPLVQKHAFGAYWTGFPYGRDLTDNKMLVMWLAWILACGLVSLIPRRREWLSRALVVLAALVMSRVYIIPHSMRGSELDYSKLQQGVDPKEAIGTSRH